MRTLKEMFHQKMGDAEIDDTDEGRELVADEDNSMEQIVTNLSEIIQQYRESPSDELVSQAKQKLNELISALKKDENAESNLTSILSDIPHDIATTITKKLHSEAESKQSDQPSRVPSRITDDDTKQENSLNQPRF